MRAWPVARSIFDAPLCERSERADNRLDNIFVAERLPDAVWPTAAKRQPRARSARLENFEHLYRGKTINLLSLLLYFCCEGRFAPGALRAHVARLRLGRALRAVVVAGPRFRTLVLSLQTHWRFMPQMNLYVVGTPLIHGLRA